MEKRDWTQEEMAYLAEHYADDRTEEIAAHLGRSTKSVHYKAKKMGLYKSREFLHRLGIARSIHPSAVANRFRPGDVPPNKGKKIWQFMSREGIERSKATRFKPGQTPHNLKPVGYERTGSDGYVYVKTEMGRPMRLKHIVEWERIHGRRRPDNMIVVFADGDRLNFSPDNLVLMTRSEAARRMLDSLSPEQRRDNVRKLQEYRTEAIRKDKLRIRWGLEPKTKLVKKWYPSEKCQTLQV